MKLNERTLVHIAQSAENPVDQSGWLLKLNDEKKDKRTFQKCWCVLKENIFFYYDHGQPNASKEPIGAIILEGYRVEIVENSAGENFFAFKLDFGTSQFGLQLKSYTFAAENQVDMEKWVKSLSCASYDYLKMVVSELQHRLDELNALKLRESITATSEFKRENLSEECSSGTVGNSRRINPFDNMEHEPTSTVTFLDLHEKYGRVIRKYFRSIEEVQATKNAETSSS